MKKVLKALLIALAIVLAVVIVYALYVLLTYSRIEDKLALDVSGSAEAAIPVGQRQTIVTWNLGFGAYSDDYSFFMDGGTESRAYSAQAVRDNIGGDIDHLEELNADLMLLQEVDTDSTRSHHVDENEMILEAFADRDAVHACNYDSAYLMYPILEPHGASTSGITTLSRYEIASSVRRSLPIETSLMKLVDLDRCYSVSRIPADDGRTLCLYNLHLSAYTSDGAIATEQLKMLLSDMAAEYAQGSYVIAGGDFNKDLTGRLGEPFGVEGEETTWCQPFPTELLPEGMSLIVALDEENPVASCRDTSKPYEPGASFVCLLDGFIVSDNVQVSEVRVIDAGFKNSDHNPVVMTFALVDKSAA